LEEDPVDPVKLVKDLKLKRGRTYEETWERTLEEIGRKNLFLLPIRTREYLLVLPRASDL
jgi:hypothetical protein